jgi:MoaA/NifB/PqqE/SkfB family radical SAM enzyme
MATAAQLCVRDSNRQLAREEFNSGKVILKCKPRAIFVELTRYCNLGCSMCRSHGQVSKVETMSEYLFSQIEETLFPTADMIDLRGWGESLVLPEFSDRARRAVRFGAAGRIVTNLSFRRDEVLELLSELGFYVGVSIDSADPDILPQLRSGANMKLIEGNLRKLSEQYHRRGIADHLNLYVTCQRPALRNLERIVDFAASLGISDIRLAPVGTSSPLLALEPARDKVREALERTRARALYSNIRVSFTASLVDGLLPKEDQEACMHPWMFCYVAFSGKIGFCDHLVGVDQYTFGDIRRQSFECIWNCPEWVALRREHLHGRDQSAPFFHECAWCYKHRHVDCEDILEPACSAGRITIDHISPTEALTPSAKDARDAS